MNRCSLCLAAAALCLAAPALAESKTYVLTIAAGDQDRVNCPVCILLPLPVTLGQAQSVSVVDQAGKQLPAQLTAPGLHARTAATDDRTPRELHFVLPNLKAKSTAVFKATISTDPPAHSDAFLWQDNKGEFTDLLFGKRLVLRYMYARYDDSTKEKRELTYKVYHHLYDPDGQLLLTKGPGGRYTHHRGLFYGFNQVSYGGKKVDIWHCPGDTHQSHEKVQASEAGPVLGRQRLVIAWHGAGKEVFAQEERELTVYNMPGGVMVEFASRLNNTTSGVIKLDGDPQHAGFHFRAAQEVAEKTEKQSYFVRPDGVGKPGEEKQGGDHPWKGMCFVVAGQRYTVCYLDRPSNPKPAGYSERVYGRFGSYFVAEVTAEQPLNVSYRIWVQKGEMQPAEIAQLSGDFVKAIDVKVK